MSINAGSLPKVYAPRLDLFPKQEVDRLRQHCQVSTHEVGRHPSRDELLSHIQDMDGLLIGPKQVVDEEFLQTAGPQLKVISNHATGLNHIDLELCKQRGVKVGFTPGQCGTTAVAELAVGLAIAACRRFPEAFRAARQGDTGKGWQAGRGLEGKQLYNSVIGVVGLGRIGLAVAHRLRSFGVANILYCGNSPKPESAQQIGAEFVTFDTLLERSDFVFATCSMNPTTRGMFDAVSFAKMKPGAVFVNVARGLLVDQDALIAALTSGHLGAAGLDVCTPEPLPSSHPLLGLPNVVLTPHIGNATVEARKEMFEMAVDNLLAGLHHKPLVASAWK